MQCNLFQIDLITQSLSPGTYIKACDKHSQGDLKILLSGIGKVAIICPGLFPRLDYRDKNQAGQQEQLKRT